MAISQTMPGPLAAQLAKWLGYLERGWLGALAVSVPFVLAPFLIVTAIAIFYARHRDCPLFPVDTSAATKSTLAFKVREGHHCSGSRGNRRGSHRDRPPDGRRPTLGTDRHRRARTAAPAASHDPRACPRRYGGTRGSRLTRRLADRSKHVRDPVVTCRYRSERGGIDRGSSRARRRFGASERGVASRRSSREGALMGLVGVDGD